LLYRLQPHVITKSYRGCVVYMHFHTNQYGKPIAFFVGKRSIVSAPKSY